MRGLFTICLFSICTGALAQQNPPPRLIPIGCNFDGGLAWLALGKTSAGPELNSFRVEISDVDLESVDVTRTHWPFLRDRLIDAYGDLSKRPID